MTDILNPELSPSNTITVARDPSTTILASENLENITVDGVDDVVLQEIRALFKQWRKHYARNVLRSAYYDAKYAFRDYGIAIPPRIKAKVETVLDWPRIAVKALADLNVFSGLYSPSQDGTPFDLDPLLQDNEFDIELPQAIVSAYTHSCSFITLANGDIQSGDPEVVIIPRAADWSAAIWDKRRRRIHSAIAITDTNDDGVPISFDVFLPQWTFRVSRTLGRWKADALIPNRLGSPAVEPLRYDPQLSRPFGRSRITRPLMGLTNAGYRTFVRMEATAEFYTAPQLWFLGLDDDAFGGDSKWSAMYGHANSISRDADGNVPDLKQVTQANMQPHTDSLMMITRMVASALNMPASAFGIVSDNPESAEAMDTAYKRLIREAQAQNRLFSRSVSRVAQKAVMLRDHESVISDELREVRATFEPVSLQSPSSAGVADAFSKYSAAIPGFSTSDVGLRFAGFDSGEIQRLQTVASRAEASSTLDRLLSGGSSGNNAGGREQAGSGSEAVGAAGDTGVANSVGQGAESQS